MEYCYSNEPVKIEMPEEGSTISFNHLHKSMRVPFIVYADFESFIKPIDTCNPNPEISYTKQYQKHTPSSFCYYIKCFDDKVYSKDPVTYTAKTDGEDVAQKCVEMLEADAKVISNIPTKKMTFGQKERQISKEQQSAGFVMASLMMTIKRLETTVISRGNIEAQHTIYATLSTRNQSLPL